MKQDSQTGSETSLSASFVARWAPSLMGHCRDKLRVMLTAALLCAMFLFRAHGAEDAAAFEYKVKAGFLFNFARFVEWPASAMPTTNSPVVIGLLREDPAAAIVRDQLQGKVANGRE